MQIDNERLEAKNRLEEILEELGELGDEAQELINSVFPEVSNLVDAYNLCQFGHDANPYSNSLQKVVEGLEIEFED